MKENEKKVIILKVIIVLILFAILVILLRMNVWLEDTESESGQKAAWQVKEMAAGSVDTYEETSGEAPKVSGERLEFLNKYIESDAIREHAIALIGQQVYLNDFNVGMREEPTGRYILEFMSIDCEHCQRSMYYIKEYEKQEESYPVEIYSFEDDPVDIEKWLKENEVDAIIQPAVKSELEKVLNIKYMPCFLFIEDHVIQFAFLNEISSTMQLDKMLELAYGGAG